MTCLIVYTFTVITNCVFLARGLLTTRRLTSKRLDMWQHFHVYFSFTRVVWFLNESVSVNVFLVWKASYQNGELSSWTRSALIILASHSCHIYCRRCLVCLIVALARSIEYSVSFFGRRQADCHGVVYFVRRVLLSLHAHVILFLFYFI